MLKNREATFTKGQIKHFRKYNIKTNDFNISRNCRENIYSFHAKLFLNCLPIYNQENKCELCGERLSDGWHLLLECQKINEIEMEALKTLKYDDQKAQQKINERKMITKSGSKNRIAQNCAWTANWTIWKFYNTFKHEGIPNYVSLKDAFLFRTSMEEFRSTNYFKKNKELNLIKEQVNWKKGNVMYKFVDFNNPKIKLKKHVIGSYFIL